MIREILLSRDSAKFIEKLSGEEKNRIRDALLQISEDPYSLPYKKIRGKKGLLRIRSEIIGLCIKSQTMRYG